MELNSYPQRRETEDAAERSGQTGGSCGHDAPPLRDRNCSMAMRTAIAIALVMSSVVGAGCFGAWAGDLGAPNSIKVVVVGLHNDDGEVDCALFGSPDGFPGDSSRAAKTTKSKIENGLAICMFADVAPPTTRCRCSMTKTGTENWIAISWSCARRGVLLAWRDSGGCRSSSACGVAVRSGEQPKVDRSLRHRSASAGDAHAGARQHNLRQIGSRDRAPAHSNCGSQSAGASVQPGICDGGGHLGRTNVARY